MKRSWIAVAILAVLFAACGLAQPHDVNAIDLTARHTAPAWPHLLGRDHLGRDVLSLLMVGASHTLVVLAVVAVVSFGIGAAVGTSAALAGGIGEAMLLRAADFFIVMPQLVIALTLTALFGLTPVSAGLALGIAGWGPYAILAHGLARRVMAQPFVLSARALGVGPFGMLSRHILPNTMDTLLTYLASDAGRTVITYAALAFIGLGADTGQADWGSLLFEYRLFIFDNPLLMVWPGLAIFVTALCLHLAFEPRLDHRVTRAMSR